MKKADLIAKLEVVKDHSPVVSIDRMIVLIQQLEETPEQVVSTKLTETAAEELLNRIEQTLDYNSNGLVDRSSAEFELSYDNRIELTDASIDVYEIMDHIRSVFDEYTSPDEDEDETEEA